MDRFSRLKRPKLLRPSVRSWKYDKLVDAVREVVLKTESYGASVEMLAWELRAKRPMVKKALYQMVREGHLHAPFNRHPWDFGWVATHWRRRRKEA